MTRTGKKRYICSFVKKDKNGELKPNVVVVAAHNNIVAKAVLCEVYDVKNVDIPKEQRWKNDMEGIKTIRLSDTNVYEGTTESDDFNNDT